MVAIGTTMSVGRGSKTLKVELCKCWFLGLDAVGNTYMCLFVILITVPLIDLSA